MATTNESLTASVHEHEEERFFLVIACLMAATLVAGFATNLAMGRSTFAVPIAYHLHAFVFFSWIALFVTQTALVASGNVALHRRLGWLSAIWVPAMVVMAITLTVVALRRTGGPFFFSANEFMISNLVGPTAFAAMVALAVRLRRRTDWHRRLMIGAVAGMLGPGFGRLLPMPLLAPHAWEISNAMGMVFVLAGMARDWRALGRVHPAWFVALASGLGWIALGEFLAYQPWGIELTRAILAGHPGAARPMAAYLP